LIPSAIFCAGMFCKEGGLLLWFAVLLIAQALVLPTELSALLSRPAHTLLLFHCLCATELPTPEQGRLPSAIPGTLFLSLLFGFHRLPSFLSGPAWSAVHGIRWGFDCLILSCISVCHHRRVTLVTGKNITL
jgi:hypothetical protein